MSFDFDDKPPQTPEARVAEIPFGESEIIVLGPHRGLWLHWQKRRTVPCDNDDCPAARHRLPVHWTGYSPACLVKLVREQDSGRHKKVLEKVVLSLNQEQADQLADQKFPVLLKVKRTKEKKGFSIRKIEQLEDHPNIPRPFSIEPTLYRLFGRRPITKPEAEE